jgi:hypothetical protein
MSAERENAWRDILTESSFALGREPLTGLALRAAMHAFERLNSDIPTRLLPEMYRRSMKLLDANGAPVYWDARAVSLAYSRFLAEREGQLDKSRLLPENAAAACERCFGTGMEEMPDDTVRPGCEHKPMTDDERRERIERGRAIMREAIRNIAKPMPAEPEPAPVEFHVEIHCTDCNRKDSTAAGWKIGEVCGARLPGPVRLELDERLACSGKMVNW